MKTISEDLIKKLLEAIISVATNEPEASKSGTSSKEQDSSENSSPYEYEVVTADEILRMEGDTLPNLVDPLFPKQGLVGFAGSSDTGKSTFLKQLAVAITRNEAEFLGFPLHVKHRSVIYVSTEDDIHAVKTVLKKQKKKGSRSSAVKGLRFLFNSEKIYQQVKAELKRQPADAVIIDAFSDIAPGDLNQSNVVRPFLDKFSNLSKEHECLMVFLHHTSKKTEGTVPKKGNLLGSQGFEAKCRLVALLVRDPNEEGIRHLCLVKGNYLPDELKTKSYALSFKEDLTFEYTGERIDIEELSSSEDQYKKKKEKEAKKKEAIVLRNIGWKLEGIAIELDVNKSTISRWLAEVPEDSDTQITLVEDVHSLKERLHEFIQQSKEYKDLNELRSKYYNGNKGYKGSVRKKFQKYLGTKDYVRAPIFAKLLEE